MNDAAGKDVIHPDYKSVIPPALIRRMSPLIRMGVGAALKCKGENKIGGIIVGSGLGCMDNTEKFLDQFTGKEEGILAPTAFIQSTHNTVAGQIALILKENGYNSTYTQRGISFENALLDAMMLSNESGDNVLVGGLDELTGLMKDLAAKVNLPVDGASEGASFFLIGSKVDGAKACIEGIGLYSRSANEIDSTASAFLEENNLEQPDLILYGDSFLPMNLTPDDVLNTKTINYSAISGNYMTNSAFGLQLASEILEGKTNHLANRILLINNFMDKDLGLTYLSKL